MRIGSSLASLLDAQRSDSTDLGDFGSHCCCARGSSQAQAIAPPAPKGHVRRSFGGAALTLFGMLGWLCVPKCPLCVAAYVAIGSGITLSFAQSQVLRQLWFVAAIGMIVVGAWRLASYGRQFIQSRRLSH